MKKILRCFLVIVFIFAGVGVSAAGSNAGFIPAPIWFSSESLSANTTTKVSTLVYNSTPDVLSLTVTFYDGDVVLGKKAGLISAQSSKEFSIDWKVTVGDHAIRAHIDNPKKGSATGPAVTLSSVDTDAYRFTVLADLGVHPFSTTPTDTKKGTTTEDKPAIVVGAQNTFDKIDGFRADTAKSIDKSIASAEKVLAEEVAPAKASSTTTTAPSKMERPLTYVKLFFLKLFSFIFSHGVLFYGLIILIIILFIRYLIRAPR